MSLIDWLIVIIPIILLVWVAVYSSRYARGVADYLERRRYGGGTVGHRTHRRM